MAMTDPNISWQRTFPESEPGTDGVATFEGRVIGRVRHMTDAPRDPKPWLWTINARTWRARQGSNLQPPASKAGALSVELRARCRVPLGLLFVGKHFF
jgi:hypothetical protein